jgi:hypothetical protein
MALVRANNHFVLLLQLRWRLFLNSLRSKKRQAEVAMSAIGYVFGALFVLGTSAGFCAAIIFLLRAGKPQLLELLLWVVFLFWQLVPLLFEGFSPGLNFREVARYPVSLRLYVMLNAAYGLFDPAALAALLWLLAIWIGIVVARPQWAIPAAGLFLLFAALNLFCNRIVMGIFERFQSTRKGRERVAVILLILMLVPQVFNLTINGIIRGPRVHLPPWTHDIVTAVRHISPPGLVLESLEPGTATVLVPLAVLASYVALAALLQVRQLRAVYLGEVYAETFTVQRKLKVKPGWRLPGINESTSAIVEKELRYIRQNVRLIVLLINPLALCAVLAFAGPFKRAFPLGSGTNLLGAFAGFLALSVSNMSYNTFGMDREGFGRWLLSPLPLENVMRAKNIAQGALLSVVYLIGGSVILYVGHVPVDMLAAVSAGFCSLLIIHLGAGNLFSVYWPKRIEFAQMNSRMTSSAAGFAALLVLLPQVLIIGIVILVTVSLKLSWLPLLAGLAGLGLSLAVYSWLTGWAVRHAEEHLEEIAGQLGV